MSHPVSDFALNKSRKRGYQSICRMASASRYAKAFAADPEKIRKRVREAQSRNRKLKPAQYRALSGRSRAKLKRACFQQYGGSCQCCGESLDVFLTIDHIDGNGAAHRRSLGFTRGGQSGTGPQFYQWLKNNGYPPGYQVLCFNCNFGKHFKKICPHQSMSGRDAHDK